MEKNMKVCQKCIYRNEKGDTYCNACSLKGEDDFDALRDLLEMLEDLNVPLDNDDDDDDLDGYDNDNDDDDEDIAPSPATLGRVSDSWLRAWRSDAADPAYQKHGIILANTENCSEEHKEEFIYSTHRFMSYKAKEGVKYRYLDLADTYVVTRPADANLNDLEFVVNILRRVNEAHPIEHLLILGDRDAIPSARWENGAGDSDKYVDSDVPYVFLETRSLFDGRPSSCSIRVGRVPAASSTGFLTARRYMENVMKLKKPLRDLNTVTLSAREWGNVTGSVFRSLSPHAYNCPPYSFVEGVGDYNISRDYPYDLLCFNLHGSPVHNTWVSGNGTAGINPSSLPASPDKLYVIGSEACYGAKPVIKKTSSQSMLITALRNRCLGFLGSTQIAYGIPDSMLAYGCKPMGADVMVGKFAERVYNGCTLGDAYIEAWNAVSSSHGRDLENVKTLCSFALYGDPTAILVERSQMKISKTERLSKLRKPEIDLSFEMKKVDPRRTPIFAVNSFVKENFSESYSLTSSIYQVSSAVNSTSMLISYTHKASKEYRATYTKTENNINNILHVYFNENGDISRAYVSK